MSGRCRQPTLFPGARPSPPEGFLYSPEFISPAEETALRAEIGRLTFGEVRMHGVTARRRVVQFGWHYSFDARRLAPSQPIPAFLEPLRERVAALTGRDPEAFGEVLLTEYQPGATIGWHRDAPPFGIVVGVSVGAPCTFRFRRGEAHVRETFQLELQPRSAYVLDGPARTDWQHSIPAATALRYSITFRTLRRPPALTAPADAQAQR